MSILHVGLIWHGAWCYIDHPDERRECCDVADRQAKQRRPIAPNAAPSAVSDGVPASVSRRAVSRRTRRTTREEATLEAAITETLAEAKPLLAD